MISLLLPVISRHLSLLFGILYCVRSCSDIKTCQGIGSSYREKDLTCQRQSNFMVGAFSVSIYFVTVLDFEAGHVSFIFHSSSERHQKEEFLVFFTSFLTLSDEATKINRMFRDVGSFIWKNTYWELEKNPTPRRYNF